MKILGIFVFLELTLQKLFVVCIIPGIVLDRQEDTFGNLLVETIEKPRKLPFLRNVA